MRSASVLPIHNARGLFVPEPLAVDLILATLLEKSNDICAESLNAKLVSDSYTANSPVPSILREPPFNRRLPLESRRSFSPLALNVKKPHSE